MKYFNYLSKQDKKELFYKEPEIFTKNTERDLLAHGLGAALYIPGIRETIARDIVEKKIKDLVSLIICLEDAVGDRDVSKGIENTISQIEEIYEALYNKYIELEEVPLIFIRIRNLEQLQVIANTLKEKLSVLTGFVIPKFSIENGQQYLKEIEGINSKYKTSLYIMPILESRNTIYLENRANQLMDLKTLFDKHKHLILNIRIGGTDFSSLFSLRRSINKTLYDIAVIRDCISHIINVFGRYEDKYVISAPVWEYFATDMNTKGWYLERSIEGLTKESALDKENGLIGKTVIHPSQIAPVQSLQVVTYEEYLDAKDILSSEKTNKGVMKSTYKNKMNEIKPHLSWAKKTIKNSQIYGVYNEKRSYKDLLAKR